LGIFWLAVATNSKPGCLRRACLVGKKRTQPFCSADNYKKQNFTQNQFLGFGLSIQINFFNEDNFSPVLSKIFA